jgi:hypothetical protein
MDQTDVLASAQRSTSGQMLTSETGATIGRCRVKAVFIMVGYSDTAGTVTLRDGGASGPIKAQFPYSATGGMSAPNYHLLPGEGILFTTNVYAAITSTNNSSYTCVFYG